MKSPEVYTNQPPIKQQINTYTDIYSISDQNHTKQQIDRAEIAKLLTNRSTLSDIDFISAG